MPDIGLSTELQISKLLAAVVEYKATDLHLTVGNPPTLRIANKLVQLSSEILLTPDFIAAIVSLIMSPEQRAILERDRSIVFVHAFKSKTRYKVHAYYQRDYISMSFRFINANILPLDRLDMPTQVQNLTQYSSGLIIISGDHGSGKTTLAAALIEYLNQHASKFIVTFEDPVEYLFNDNLSIIDQREMNRDVKTLADVIPFCMQEDVDVVFLAYSFTAETITTAIQLARMGKLVIVELPGQSIVQTLSAIVQLFPNDRSGIRASLAEILKAMVALKALPNTAGGIAVASEVICTTTEIAGIVRADDFNKLVKIMEQGGSDGMLSLETSIQQLIQSGRVSAQS